MTGTGWRDLRAEKTRTANQVLLSTRKANGNDILFLNDLVGTGRCKLVTEQPLVAEKYLKVISE